jgi:hypothetical protein
MREAGDLTELQRLLAKAVRSDAAVPGAPWVADAERLLVPSARGLSPADRLEIYREQFWLRHVANLVDDFPTLGWVTGAPAFRELAATYLEAYPPRTWELQRLGADLPAYVACHSRWGRDALAVDACRLDWTFMEAFDAADTPPLDLSVLAGAQEDAVTMARVSLHPSLRLLALEHPVHELRETVKRAVGGGEAIERPAEAPTLVVVWRDAACVLKALPIDPAAFALLSELAAGTPLGQACERAAQTHGDDVGARVGGWFQEWTSRGWIGALAV